MRKNVYKMLATCAGACVGFGCFSLIIAKNGENESRESKNITLSGRYSLEAWAEGDGVGDFGNAEITEGESTAAAEAKLGETKYMLSKNRDYLLLATALENYENVYEVGYDFGETYSVAETDVAETDKYYTGITVSDAVTWHSQDIFGSAYADLAMIVWEVSYDEAVEYRYAAYAKVGTRNENGELVKSPEDSVASSAEKVTPITYKVNFALNYVNIYESVSGSASKVVLQSANGEKTY